MAEANDNPVAKAMTESALLLQYNENLDTIFGLIQWWVSVSFGTAVIAHFASDRLHYVWPVALLVVYLAYTLVMTTLVGQMIVHNGGILDALGYLWGGEEPLSQAGIAVLEVSQIYQRSLIPDVWISAASALPIGITGFVVYRALTSRRDLSNPGDQK